MAWLQLSRLIASGVRRTECRSVVAISLDNLSSCCEDRQVETIKKIISKDGKHRLDIEVSPGGLYRCVTFDDRYRNDPDFHAPPEWTIDAFSGLYESVEAVEADAILELAWLRE